MPVAGKWVRGLLVAVAALAVSCAQARGPAGGMPTVVATMFPLYDFAREVAGGRARVVMLVPPGVEPHSFEPRPGDILTVAKASVFVYTGEFMEPWAADILEAAKSPGLVTVDAGKGCALIKGEEGREGHGHHATDPHIWLDFSNAQIMAENITAALERADPANAAYYRANGAKLKADLAGLDGEFSRGLAECRSRTIAHGGHFAFAYLARRYGLEYLAAYGLSPDSEPSPKNMAELVKSLKANKGSAVFYEELISPKIAEAVSRETGAAMMRLHGGHNVGADEFKSGVRFADLMRANLRALRAGLGCTEE